MDSDKNPPISNYISEKRWKKLKEEFTKKNFYRQSISCPRFINKETKRFFHQLQEKLWGNVLRSLEDLFEVDDYHKIYNNDLDNVEDWILLYYEPSEELVNEILESSINIKRMAFSNQREIHTALSKEKENFIANIKAKIRN